MSNEIVFVLLALLDIIFVSFAAKKGTEWLYGTIATNLILIALFGAKIIGIFGLVTNAGNAFYACIFLATYFLLEQHGKQAAVQAVWFGAVSTIFFVVLTQCAAFFNGPPLSTDSNEALRTLFSFSLRVTVASILAFVFAQSVNISLFEWIKKNTDSKLWLRTNVANIVSQLVDSLLFFSIAFYDMPGPLLVQTILAGWLVKSAVVFLGTPFLYFILWFDKKKI